ncbi:hypothetical protein JCM8097_003002 [Rhodosporidiobolus ruineniae]
MVNAQDAFVNTPSNYQRQDGPATSPPLRLTVLVDSLARGTHLWAHVKPVFTSEHDVGDREVGVAVRCIVGAFVGAFFSSVCWIATFDEDCTPWSTIMSEDVWAFVQWWTEKLVAVPVYCFFWGLAGAYAVASHVIFIMSVFLPLSLLYSGYSTRYFTLHTIFSSVPFSSTLSRLIDYFVFPAIPCALVHLLPPLPYFQPSYLAYGFYLNAFLLTFLDTSIPFLLLRVFAAVERILLASPETYSQQPSRKKDDSAVVAQLREELSRVAQLEKEVAALKKEVKRARVASK